VIAGSLEFQLPKSTMPVDGVLVAGMGLGDGGHVGQVQSRHHGPEQ
jgi:hypothetical protein